MIFWEKRKAVTALYEKKTRAICDRYQLTQMEYDILMFLYNNPTYTTATDIVSIRRLTKSHVSSALKMLEDKGYIRRFYEENNSKTAHIEVLKLAEGILQDGYNMQMDFLPRSMRAAAKGENDAAEPEYPRSSAVAIGVR